jgi:outer membrane protein insertion porin family
MVRKTRLVLIGAAGAILLALLAAHAPPARALVLRRVVEAAHRSLGIELHAESLSYNLLTLSAEVRSIQLATVGAPAAPFAAADTLAISFGARTLIGDISIKRLSIASPRIHIQREADGSDNLPRVSNDTSTAARVVLPPIRVDDLDVTFQQPATSAAMRGAAVQLTSVEAGGIAATIKAQHGVTMTAGDHTIDFDAFAVTVNLDDNRLDVRELTASRRDAVLHASGVIGLRGDGSTVDITVKASSDLARWWIEQPTGRAATRPIGHADATARITGLLSDPTVAVETNSASLAWSDMQVSDLRARGSYRRGQLSLSTVTFDFAGGTVEAHGEIVLDDARRASRIEARWAQVDARQITGAAGLTDIAKTGTAVVEWRPDGNWASPRFDITATTGLVGPVSTIPLVVQGSGHGDRWRVEATAREANAVDLSATVDIEVDSERWQASTIAGRVVLRTTDLPAAIGHAQRFGVPADFDSTTATGAIDIDATIDGTLGAVRSSGRMIGRTVTVAGLPQLDLDASFGIDAAAKTSIGTLRLQASRLESATFAAENDLTLGGTLVALATWSGPISDPAVEGVVTGRNLAVRNNGSLSIAAANGVFDGVLKGPIMNPGGEGKLTIGSVEIGGRDAGGVSADLTLSEGTLRVAARAPSVNTTLGASIGLENPNSFEGHGTLADSDIAALLKIAGLEGADADAVRGGISSSISFKGDMQNWPSTTVALDVAPINATVLEVPLAMSRGLRASLRGSRVEFEDVGMTIGGLAVRLGGTLDTDGAGGRLVLDMDGDLGPLTPWLMHLSGNSDVVAAGRITGHVEAEASSAGLTTTGTIDTTLSTLSDRDRVLAKDMRASIVLTGQRAEVRDATGLVRGGQLQIAAEAPLLWLNQWLPSGFQIAQPAIDRPAALEGTATFDVPAVFELLGRTPPDGVGGRFELAGSLVASEPDLAAVTGDLRLERAEVNSKELRYGQSDITRFRLANGAIGVESLDWGGPGSTVVGRGSVGLLTGVETDVRLDVDTDLGILGTLLSGRATGRLTGNIELHGQSGALRVTSDATLSDGSWLIPGQRILFAGWSGHIRLEDQALEVTKLGGTVNGGSIRVNGRLPFAADTGGGALTIMASDILIDVPRGLHSQLGADLVWRLTESRAQLQGNVEVTANHYTEPVTRILQLVNSLSLATRDTGQATLPSWLAGTTLDINMAVTDPIVIDNSVGTVELLPDLRLGGTIDSPSLSGRIDVVDDGRITIGGRLYRLRDSQLRFAPDEGLVPTLDAIGDTRIGNYDVTIRITGTPDRIETSFSSVPPLGERDLQSLIVTGQASEPSGDSRQSDDNFAAAAAATDILGFAGKFVGLDSVRIGAADLELVSKDVSTAQHLTVLKSLGSSFDLIFSDNLEDGSVTWVLVWKPTAVNEIRASSVEDGTRSLEFRRTVVFGPGAPAGTANARRAAAAQSRTIVDAVRITGAPGFTEPELSQKLELGPGARFNVRQWIEDRHRLENFYLERGYQRVRIASTRSRTTDPSHVSLTYNIERGPKTIIEVTGDRLPADVLDAMYDAWRGLPVADVVRTEFERIARQGLARRGYYRPALQLEFSAETSDLARVTMHVSRGPQTRGLMIAWSGNREVSKTELDALVAPHLAESAVWLDTQALAWQVRQLYAARGHLQAEVSVRDPVFHATEATFPIAIDEGVLSRLAALKLEGVDPARTAGADAALGLSIGDALSASTPVESARRLKAFYGGLGYRNAAVTYTLTTAKDGSVSLAWVVKEGPLYVVKDVNVVGVETTSGGLVRKAISVGPGDAMSQSAIDTTRRNLYDIGSFRRVDFDFGDSAIPAENADELPLTLTIRAEEQQRFQLKYGVQFSFDRSADRGGGNALGGSVELRDRNFIGRAVQASVGAHWDPDLQTIGLLLSSPRMFGKRVRTNVYARDRREQDVIDSTSSFDGATLDDRRRELTLEQRWRPVSAFELVWGYNVSSRRFLLDQVSQRSDGGGLLAGPVVSVILDRRDNPFDATQGLFHSSSLQFGAESLGSDLSYVRYLFRQSYYQPVGRVTAAGSVRYGTMLRYSGRAPISIIDLLFNAGGTNSVRGYAEDSLSAINIAGFALGGIDLLVLNGELRFAITKRLGAAAFVDAGNTFAAVADIALGRLAVGAGLGLRLRTPLAPLRLDVAYPISNEYGVNGVRVHFSIGQMF